MAASGCFNVVWFNSVGLKEAAETIYHGLCEAGFDAVFTEGLRGIQAHPERQRIIFGVFLGRLLRERLPGIAWQDVVREHDILYNSEQLRPALIDRYEIGPLLASRTVWDYSTTNVQALRELGCPNARLVPLGGTCAMQRIPHAATDTDVMFYGLINPRRAPVLEALRSSGLRCRIHDSTNAVWGAERDALIARSKVVLNIHYYDSRIFEPFRLVYLLTNGCCVISEDGSDPAEAPYRDALVLRPITELVAACQHYATDDTLRRAQANRARDILAAYRQADILRAALLE